MELIFEPTLGIANGGPTTVPPDGALLFVYMLSDSNSEINPGYPCCLL